MPSTSKLFTGCFSSVKSRSVEDLSDASQSRARVATLCGRSENEKRETFPQFVIHWIRAKVKSCQWRRREKAEFKEKLNNWVQDAPTDFRKAYQKIARELEKCFRQKTDNYNIYRSPISVLPPIPDHVKILNIVDCPSLQTLKALPEQLESLQVWDCPRLGELPTFPSQLKLLNVSNCRRLIKIPQLPHNLSKLKLYMTDRICFDFPKILETISEDAAPLEIYTDWYYYAEDLSSMLFSPNPKGSSYQGSRIDFYRPTVNYTEDRYLSIIPQDGVNEKRRYQLKHIEGKEDNLF